MKTRIKNLLLLLLLLGLPGVVKAKDAYSTNADGSIYTYRTNADGSANIAAYAGPPWVVAIPTNINGLTVTSIGESAFFDCTNLTSVTIPNSVASIGDYAFYDCTSLTSVTIPNRVTSVGVQAFYDCSSLTSVTIGNSVTSIGNAAFFGCSRLTNLTIPNSVTSIGVQAFYYCSSLTSIMIPNDLTNCVSAFGGSSLTNVTFASGTTSILPDEFSACTDLTSITIPNSVTSIGDGAFGGCGLTSVTIPGSVTSIGDDAFEDCSGLTNAAILNGVTSIGDDAFASCTKLTSVYFTGNAPSPTNDSTVFAGDPATVYYLPGTTGWGALFDGLPTAPWFLPNPQILTHSASFGVQPSGFGFTISWATNASVVVQAATNLANPVWIPVSTNTLTGGTNYFSDPQWTNYPARFYRTADTFTVGGTVTGLAAWDSITLHNGGDYLTLSTNGTFTFPTALPNGQAYSLTLYTTSGQVACTFSNGSGTISGANVTNVAVSCIDGCPALTGNRDLDMYNAAVSDGTANGGVPGVMLTENGGPFRVTAAGTYDLCSDTVAEFYPGWAVFTHVVGNTSCSSTSFPSGTSVIQFGTPVKCGFGPYKY